MNQALDKQELRATKKREVIEKLAFIKHDTPYFESLYNHVVAQLNAAKNRAQMREIERTIPLVQDKYAFIGKLQADFDSYQMNNSARSNIKDDAVLYVYDNFIENVINSDATKLNLLKSQASLLLKKYQFLSQEIVESCTAVYWMALVNHVTSLQNEAALDTLSKLISRSINNHFNEKSLRKKISDLEKELEKLGFNPNKEAILSTVSEKIKSEAECFVQFTQEKVAFCEESINQYKQDLDFLLTKIEKIKQYISDDHEAVKTTTVIASPSSLHRHKIGDKDYYNPYKIIAHQFIAAAKTQEELDKAIKLFCLAEHKQSLRRASHVIFPPPSNANLYLGLAIQDACTSKEIKTLYQMFAILECIQNNYPIFLNVMSNFIFDSDLDNEASIARDAFEVLSNTNNGSIRFLNLVVAFCRRQDPHDEGNLWRRYSEEDSDVINSFNNSCATEETWDQSNKKQLSELIDKTRSETKSNEARKQQLNEAVNNCLRTYYANRNNNSNEYKQGKMPSWLFSYNQKYNPYCHKKEDKLEAVERLYARQYLRKTDVDCLNHNELYKQLLSATGMSSMEDLLSELGYTDNVDEAGAKYYCRLTVGFELCPLLKEKPDGNKIPIQDAIEMSTFRS